MRHLKVLVFLFMLAAAWSQSRPPAAGTSNPNNIYSTTSANPGPNGQVTFKLCAWKLFNGVVYWQSGVTVNADTYVTTSSGWHGHEGTYHQVDRPQATLSAYSGTTDSTGCVPLRAVFPPLAGWYTIEGHFTGPDGSYYPADGVNLYLKWPPFGSSLASFTAYPDTPYNVPQSSYFDPNHKDDSGNSVSRYFEPYVQESIYTASSWYISDTLSVFGVTDYLNVLRGSLPDGGTADNQSYSYGAADWVTQTYEEHAKGVEVDLKTPPDSPHRGTVAAAMFDQDCYLGIYQPDGGRLSSPTTYWYFQTSMHFVCDSTINPGQRLGK